MSYSIFQSKILRKFKKARISCDDKGRYHAYIEGGIRITGNSISKQVTVMWGDGHCAVASL